MSESIPKARTKKLALRIIDMTEHLPRTRFCEVAAKQVLRSGTSVGANYRAACRARSAKEFCAKLGIVEVEADETLYWLELIEEKRIFKPSILRPLMVETNEVLAMAVASIRTAQRKK